MVKCKIFDSWDWMDMSDEMWENWEEWFDDEEKPEVEPEHELIDRAREYIQYDYSWLVEDFKAACPRNKNLILSGTLGLWWGRPFVYKTVTPDDALEWMYDDMSVYYEDGEIVIRHYHHDGTNTLYLQMLKDWNDLPIKEFSDEEIKELEATYDDLSRGYCLENFQEKWVDKVTTSTARYFKDHLSQEALDDLACREALVAAEEE